MGISSKHSKDQQHQQDKRMIIGMLRKNAYQIIRLFMVFMAGNFVGRWQERRSPPPRPATTPRIQHGSILRLSDLPWKSTSHVDSQGRPVRKQQFIAPFAIPNFSGFQVATLQAGQAAEIHSHTTMHEIFYVISGKALFTINKVEHQALPGTMIHLAPREKHGILAQESPDGDLVMAYFGVTID